MPKENFEQSPKSSDMLVVTDHYSDVDKIGYSAYANALVEMIHSVRSSGSFTIGIYGQWGQGKTSMLRQIEKALSSEDAQKEDQVLTVWFNPWQFTAESHLIVPFFHVFIQTMKSHESNVKYAKIKGKITSFLKEIAGIPVALAYGTEGKGKIPFFGEISWSGAKIIDESRAQHAKAKPGTSSESAELVKKYESMYYSLLNVLQGAAKQFGGKIVVFLDDLDRCLPEKSIELLESFKVLLDIEGFIFVIGVAPEIIDRAVRVRYKDYYSSGSTSPLIERNYLDKIIQFPLTLPPPDNAQLQNYLRNELLKDLTEASPYLETIIMALGDNPRSIKRFINEISFMIRVGKLKELDNSGTEAFSTELIIKMALLQYQFGDFYKVLCRDPYHLIRVESAIANISAEKGKEEGKDQTETIFGFPELDGLSLLREPNLRSVKAILGKQKRPMDSARSLEDQGFQTMESAIRYIGMLASVASASKSAIDGHENPISALGQIMKSRMKQIKARKFMMGEEKEVHEVSVGSLEIDKFLMTQALYSELMGGNPSHFLGDDKPVEQVSWFDAIECCNRLSEKMNLKKAYIIKDKEVSWDFEADGFRLPTEAEWEYACRARTTDERYGNIDEIAWYEANAGGETHSVGQKLPNQWGLYDMLGNVWEWVWDWYGNSDLKNALNPIGPPAGSDRVLRGGAWLDDARGVRSAFRYRSVPGARIDYIGFRLARGHRDK